MYDLGAGAPQFKFNTLFNKHFFLLFLNILFGKNWRGGGGLLFEVGIIDGYYCNNVITSSL